MAVLMLFCALPLGSFASDVKVPEDAVEFNGNYYKVYEENKKWTEAEAWCEEQGGHLVTITSAEEQAFIERIITGDKTNIYWIGLRLDTVPQAWVTNESLSYTNWSENNPDHRVDGEVYVNIYGKDHVVRGETWQKKGQWNDLTDSATSGEGTDADFYQLSKTGFICEWEAETLCKEHLWDLDIQNSAFKCHNCGKKQSISPVLGYDFNNDKFSFSNSSEEFGSYAVSLVGFSYMDPSIKLDVISHFANGMVGIANLIDNGTFWSGSCFGFATMNASFFSGMPVSDFGKSRVAELSVANASYLVPNQDTKLKDAINIMFFSQSTVVNQLFQAVDDFGNKNIERVVELAKGLRPGDYPPVINFKCSLGGHTVNIIGIEPDDFWKDYYCVTLYDSNSPAFPSIMMIKKDYSEALYVTGEELIDPEKEQKNGYPITKIGYSITSPNYNIDLWAPGLRTSPLYQPSEATAKMTGLQAVTQSADAITEDKIKEVEENYVSFNISSKGNVVIEDALGRKVHVSDGEVNSADIENITVVPVIGTTVKNIILPYTAGKYKISADSNFYAHINYNSNIAVIASENGGTAEYTADGKASFAPVDTTESSELSYYRYDLFKDTDIVGVMLKGQFKENVSIDCSKDVVEVNGKIENPELFVHHNNDNLDIDTLDLGTDKTDKIKLIYDEENDVVMVDVSKSENPNEDADKNEDKNEDKTENACPFCGKVHGKGFIERVIAFFHMIFAFFKKLFHR